MVPHVVYVIHADSMQCSTIHGQIGVDAMNIHIPPVVLPQVRQAEKRAWLVLAQLVGIDLSSLESLSLMSLRNVEVDSSIAGFLPSIEQWFQPGA